MKHVAPILRDALASVAVASLLASLLGACAMRTHPDTTVPGAPSETSPVVADARAPAASHASLVIVTGPDRETDHVSGLDLSRVVAAPLGIDLEVRQSKGAIDNMHRLHDDTGVDLAIVQYDVLRAFDDEARKGDAVARSFVRPIRIVAPLYTQEIHFIVRRDSPLRSIDQLSDRKINLGVVGSGSALTAAAVYRELFDKSIAPAQASYLDARQALIALTIDRSIDVMVVIAGQPAAQLADLKPEAREFIRLLPLDPRQPSSRAALRRYFPATIRATTYPQWLAADVPTLSVMSVLVTAADHGRDATLASFTRSLCAQINTLRRQGNPKWREVDPTLKLGSAFAYLPASASLDRCPGAGASADTAATQ